MGIQGRELFPETAIQPADVESFEDLKMGCRVEGTAARTRSAVIMVNQSLDMFHVKQLRNWVQRIVGGENLVLIGRHIPGHGHEVFVQPQKNDHVHLDTRPYPNCIKHNNRRIIDLF